MPAAVNNNGRLVGREQSLPAGNDIVRALGQPGSNFWQIQMEPNARRRLGVHVAGMWTMIGVRLATQDFSEFFRREYRRLARACLLLTSDRAEAEELAQEALSRAYARWDELAGMDSPTGYVYRTALNLNRKRLRHLAVRARHALTPRPPLDEVGAAERRLDVLREIRALPRGQREALVMVEWLDLDVEEAASLLGIAPSSVRGRLFRARHALRERFGGTDA